MGVCGRDRRQIRTTRKETGNAWVMRSVLQWHTGRTLCIVAGKAFYESQENYILSVEKIVTKIWVNSEFYKLGSHILQI